MITKQQLPWVVLVLLAAGIKLFSLFPDAVERYYSNGIYLVTARLQRWLFGWVPFSVGDLFYGLLGIYLIYKIIELVKLLRKRQAGKTYWVSAMKRVLFTLLFVYVSFNLLWGLNYNRRGITYQLGLSTKKLTKEELGEVMELLVFKINRLDSAGKTNRADLNNEKKLFGGAIASYKNLEKMQSIFAYPAPSIKSTLFVYLGNYLGYTGYYNPFTGEGQVNTKVPLFIQPFTTCHEIGHQLGYAKENEANFAAYLSAKNSQDSAFLYSVYFELYSYGRPYLYKLDSVLLKTLDKQLLPGVKNDFRELQNFFLRYENPVERAIDKLYGRYLKANEQPSGKVTYSEVIIWLIAYYNKYGKDAL